MQSYIFSFLFTIICGLNLHAQSILENSEFDILDSLPCSSDSTVIVVQPKYWEIYQTENNLWDGERTESCISFHIDEYGYANFETFQIDLEHTIFVRYNADTMPLLSPDTIYGISADALGFVSYLNECLDQSCTGYFLRISVPDSTGLRTIFRDHWLPREHDGYDEACFGTERFQNMFLHEFVFQIRFNPDQTTDDTNAIVLSHFEPVQYQEILTKILIQDSHWNTRTETYELQSFDLVQNFSQNILVKYGDENNYPSPDNIYFLDAILANNVDQKRTININIFGALVFQPFTQIRGGQIDGSDSVRHQVNLRMDYGQFCIYNPAEVGFEKSNHFIYSGGSVNFSGRPIMYAI